MLVALNDIKPMNTNIKGATSVAKINIDGYAFQALSGKNLYKNVIRAIVREISCNALDAHVMAGTEDKPFDVHIPTMMEPYFAVRDYGIGLDDDGVRNVYLTYFGSTKRESNTQIGAWGLGSKSPLGYTDNFTVTAVKDGVERIYSVFKNQDGIPSISIICENPTDKHNGLEIRLALVNNSDVEMFKREAVDVLQWFDVKPNFNVEVQFEKPACMIENLGGNINVLQRGNGSVVVHGNIAYNLDPDMLKLGWSDYARKLASHGVQIFMEHGTVEYSMSREELSYTDRTIDNIVSALKNATKDIVAKLQTTFEGVHQFDAYSKLESLKRVSFMSDEQYNELMKLGVSPLHLMQHDHFDVSNECRKMGVKLYYKDNGRRGGTNIKVGEMEYLYPTNVTNMTFYVNDEKREGTLAKKLKHNAHKLAGKVISIPPAAVAEFTTLVHNVLDINIKVVSSTELEDLPSVKRAKKDASDEIVYRRLQEKTNYRRWGSDRHSYNFEKDGTTFEPSNVDKYYVALKGFAHETLTGDTINALCKSWGVERSDVFGVSKKNIKHLDSSWTDLFAHIKPKVEAKLEQYKLHGKQCAVQGKIMYFIDELEKHDDVAILRKATDKQALSRSDVLELKIACRIFGIGVECTSEMDSFDSMVEVKEQAIRDKYPLLACTNDYEGNTFKEHMIKYIEMVNQL